MSSGRRPLTDRPARGRDDHDWIVNTAWLLSSSCPRARQPGLERPVRPPAIPRPQRRPSTGFGSELRVHDVLGQRSAAPVVHRALRAGAAVVLAGERDPAAVRSAMAAVVAQVPLGELDYAEVVLASDLTVPSTLEPTDVSADLRLLAAVRFGTTRLIDNLGVTVPAAPTDRS